MAVFGTDASETSRLAEREGACAVGHQSIFYPRSPSEQHGNTFTQVYGGTGTSQRPRCLERVESAATYKLPGTRYVMLALGSA